MFEILIPAGAVAILAAVGYFVYTSRRRDEPEVHHAHCPRCDQRVRFGPDRAGSQVRCPRCRRPWTLPGTPIATAVAARVAVGDRGLVRRISAITIVNPNQNRGTASSHREDFRPPFFVARAGFRGGPDGTRQAGGWHATIG